MGLLGHTKEVSKLAKLGKLKTYFNLWSVGSFIFIALIVMSNVYIFTNLFTPANENWQHIKEYLLKDYITNSLILVLFTSIFTVLIGTSLAWLITIYNFPGKKFFKWALILPLAVPPNIAAYTYTGLLNYTGFIQTSLRSFGYTQVNQKYFDLMNMYGAIFIFTMFLFPYVYTITKAFWEKQSASLIESARILGRRPTEIFFTVALPISRAAIIGGVSLVMLETLNDYGVVDYFGIPTFSTAIFKTWFAMGDLNSAVRLSAILLLIVFNILMLEKFLRGRKRYSYTTPKVRPITPQKLLGFKGLLAFKYCFFVFSLGFLIPALQLLYWFSLTYRNVLDPGFWQLMLNSLSVALTATVLIIVTALIIANYCRINNHMIAKIYARITVVGYSIPGAVIAVGVMILFISLDQHLHWFYQLINPQSAKLMLSTSVVMLVFAYVIRFLAVGFNSVQTGFEKVGNKFFEASRTLGMSTTQTFTKVDLPMIKPAIFSGCVLVFVEIMKELPLTLLLRPFNFDTLATKVFQYASDEMIPEAAVPAMVIIITSFISIYFFHRVTMREEK